MSGAHLWTEEGSRKLELPAMFHPEWELLIGGTKLDGVFGINSLGDESLIKGNWRIWRGQGAIYRLQVFPDREGIGCGKGWRNGNEWEAAASQRRRQIQFRKSLFQQKTPIHIGHRGLRRNRQCIEHDETAPANIVSAFESFDICPDDIEGTAQQLQSRLEL